MTAAADIQRAVLIHHRVVTRDFGTGRIFAVDNGFAVVVRGRIVTVNLCAGAAVADGVVAVIVDDGFITVDQNTNGIRIGNRHTALVVHRGAVAGDINPVTAAADIQYTVLNNFPVITGDLRASGIFTINDGFAIVVYCGIITRNNKLTVMIILPLRCAICAHPVKGNRVIRFINLPNINSCLTAIAIL